jgi:hypothetical protein
MNPTWARLVDRWQVEGHVGLTPSFLVGALREPPGAVLNAPASFAELRGLLDAMRNEPLQYGKVVKVFECQNLRQPVIALSTDRSGHLIPGAEQRAQLYIWPWYEPEREVDFDWLLHALWCHVRSSICDGLFSYSKRLARFETFSPSDLAFIQRALADVDDA